MQFPKTILRLHFSYLLLFCLACSKPDTNAPETCVGGLHISTTNYNSDSVSVFAPNIFTPDGYGAVINERFFILTRGITRLDMKIVKDGVVVFESDDLNEGWDGKVNGKIDHGIYVYSATAITIHNEKLEMTGFIRSAHGTHGVSNCEECRFADQIVLPHGFVNPTQEGVNCK